MASKPAKESIEEIERKLDLAIRGQWRYWLEHDPPEAQAVRAEWRRWMGEAIPESDEDRKAMRMVNAVLRAKEAARAMSSQPIGLALRFASYLKPA